MKHNGRYFITKTIQDGNFIAFLLHLILGMLFIQYIVLIPYAVQKKFGFFFVTIMILLALGAVSLKFYVAKRQEYLITSVMIMVMIEIETFLLVTYGVMSYSVAVMWCTSNVILIFLLFKSTLRWIMLAFYTLEFIYLYSNILIQSSALTRFQEQSVDTMSVLLIFAVISVLIVAVLQFQEKFYSYQNNQITLNGKKIEQAGTAKSQFLANMSYEIRTPMNAIINLSEIMLREESDEETKAGVKTIQSASYDLLSIIDDVLTYAKIDAGDMHLLDEVYSFAKLVKSITRSVSDELQQKDINLHVKINHNIPRLLMGDSVVISQIFLYLLFISIEFTSSGRVILEVNCENDYEKGKTLLRCKIADTGKGLSKIDIQSLFGAYTTYDSRQSSNMKGVGLKYSICKELLSMMEGSIRVESIEGVGTCTYFEFYNEIVDEAPMVSLENAKKPDVLVYVSDDIQMNKWQNIMEGFGIRPTYAHSYYGFDRAVQDRQYDFIFVPDAAYENLQNIISLYQCEEHTYVSTVHNAIYGDFGKCRLFYNPFSCITVADILNHKWNKDDYKHSATVQTFTAKKAKVLVVDDNAVNLKVAAGIFSKYGINISVATCGQDGLKKMESERYDLILMDMVMPDMSGSDVLQQIRAKEDKYYKEVPVVALTAQNGTNAREELLKLGFQEYLSKPIKRRYLEHCLLSFLPEELIEKVKSEEQNKDGKAAKEAEQTEQVPGGLNTEKGLLNIGFNQDAYAAILNTYYSEGLKYLDMLPNLLEVGNIQLFTTNVHGIKSSSASIGAMEVSGLFKELEFAGKEGRVDEIRQKFPGYMEKFKEILGIVKEYLVSIGKMQETEEADNLEEKEAEELNIEMLTDLKAELDRMNLKVTDVRVPELATRNFGTQANQQIRKLKEAYDMFDFHQVKAILNDMIAGMTENIG